MNEDELADEILGPKRPFRMAKLAVTNHDGTVTLHDRPCWSRDFYELPSGMKLTIDEMTTAIKEAEERGDVITAQKLGMIIKRG